MTTQLKFIPRYINEILEGEKTLTIRYGWSENNIPEEGERILLKNSQNGVTFATAKVDWTDRMTMQTFVDETWEGHKEYESLEEIIWSLGHFYDESEMDGQSEIDVIGWTNLNSMYGKP